MKTKPVALGLILALMGVIPVVLRQFFKKSPYVLFKIVVCPSVLLGFTFVIVGIGICGYGIGVESHKESKKQNP